tara:strand:- start:131 stop:427 length:297 start_codon:yes stop_codon:yes gene_type:complete
VLTADLVEVTSLFVVRKVRVLGTVLEKTPVQRKTAGHDGFIADFRQPFVEDVLLKVKLQTEILGSQLGLRTHEIPWGKKKGEMERISNFLEAKKRLAF